MFKSIVVSRGRCDYCRQTRLLATLPPAGDAEPYNYASSKTTLSLCASCIYKATRLAAMLVGFERPAKPAKAKTTPKKARKSATREPSAIAPPSSEPEHGTVLGDRELHEAGL